MSKKYDDDFFSDLDKTTDLLKAFKPHVESESNNKNLSRELRDSFVMANQGKTNLEIFMESISPLYKNNIDCPFLKLKLMDIFNKFKDISLLGLKNVYCFNGELIYLSYILSLERIVKAR